MSLADDARDVALIYDSKKNRYKGVYPSGDAWQAIIQGMGIAKYLGRFYDQRKAAIAIVNWYRDNYGPLWQRMLSRTSRGKRVPWVISRIRHQRGWIARVWVNNRPILVTPERIGCYGEGFIEGKWESKPLAKEAVKVFVGRFRTRKIDRPVLFRL